jgi:predicted phage terminase large subunit-like protein
MPPNPQNLRPPFPKGVSGNPKGRPRKGQAFADLLELIDETPGARKGIAKVWLQKILKGEFQYFREFLERSDGKVATPADDIPIDPSGRAQNHETLNAWLKRATPEHDWDAPHLVLLQEKLQAIDRGELKRLIVSMPPRHGKSELLSVHAPVWFLERNPKREIIPASYAISLSRKFSRKARNLAVKMGLPLNPKVAQASEWETAEGGRVYAVGVGGGIAGHGADILIVDDPVKNVQEASSPLVREKIWDWFVSEAMTRLSPSGAAIVIMTRRHEADLIGSLTEGRDAESGETEAEEDEPAIDGEAERWDYVRIPAISEGEGDPLGRAEGEGLWKRWPIEALHRIRKRGEWLFAALYQQRPTPRSGGLFQKEWFSKYVDRIPAGDGIQFVRYWDKASSLANDADFTAGVLMAYRDDVLYVCDVIEKRVSPKGRRDLQKTCAENDPRNTITWIEHEGGSAGADAAEEEAKALAGHPVHWEHPTGPKWLRAESFASQCEAGNVVLVKASWNRKFIEQLCSFPNGKHDDMVDAASGACRKLTAKRRVRVL